MTNKPYCILLKTSVGTSYPEQVILWKEGESYMRHVISGVTIVCSKSKVVTV
jgi:hypothetical protein